MYAVTRNKRQNIGNRFVVRSAHSRHFVPICFRFRFTRPLVWLLILTIVSLSIEFLGPFPLFVSAFACFWHRTLMFPVNGESICPNESPSQIVLFPMSSIFLLSFDLSCILLANGRLLSVQFLLPFPDHFEFDMTNGSLCHRERLGEIERGEMNQKLESIQSSCQS